MSRKALITLHRTLGLGIAFFLLVTSCTGVLLAFYDELDEYLNPQLHRVQPVGEAMSLAQLEQRLHHHLSQWGQINYLRLPKSVEHSIQFRIKTTTPSSAISTRALDFDWVFMNPYSGQILGTRLSGAWRLDRAHLMPLILNLHQSLTLPSPWGRWLIGAAALLWIVDCFAGLALTIPPSSKRKQERGMSRWRQSWTVKWTSARARMIRDLHTALSLWLWAMLLIFAVSSVALNLFDEVYRPLVGSLMAYERARDALPDSKHTQASLSFAQAQYYGRLHMANWQTEEPKLSDYREDSILYDAGKNAYRYSVSSSLDLPNSYAQTRLYLSAEHGKLLSREHPQLDTGNTLSAWLFALHTAQIFGTWYQIVVSLLGGVVFTLTVTGLLIWRRKRRPTAVKRKTERMKSMLPSSPLNFLAPTIVTQTSRHNTSTIDP